MYEYIHRTATSEDTQHIGTQCARTPGDGATVSERVLQVECHLCCLYLGQQITYPCLSKCATKPVYMPFLFLKMTASKRHDVKGIRAGEKTRRLEWSKRWVI